MESGTVPIWYPTDPRQGLCRVPGFQFSLDGQPIQVKAVLHFLDLDEPKVYSLEIDKFGS